MKYDLDLAIQSVGEGWENIIRTLWAFKPKDTTVDQVKEKFGGLRFYIGPTTKEYRTLVSWGESISYRTCEWCGKRGTLDQRYFWLLTLCTQCKRKRKRELNSQKTRG